MGIGEKLAKAVFSRAKENGIKTVYVGTQSTNAPAISFYIKLGFEIVNIDLSYYPKDKAHKNQVLVMLKRTFDGTSP